MKFKAILLAITVSTFPELAIGQEDSKPFWNPFAQSSAPSGEDVRESTFFKGAASESESLFKLPSFSWPKKEKSTKAKRPSTFSKISSTSKSWWGSTADFLNPFDSPPVKKQQGYQPQNQEPKDNGGGMFSWLWPEKTPEPPANVNEFLRQPRPKF